MIRQLVLDTEYDAELKNHRLWLQGNTLTPGPARLSNCDLRYVKNLLPEQLAGMDLTNSLLPEDRRSFDALKLVEEGSRNAKKLFQIMLLSSAYAFLTVGITTDVDLLTNSGLLTLPLIGAEVSIVWFYLLMPAVLTGMYFYFNLYLQRNWEALSTLPARFPDGKPIARVVYPWIMNGLAWRNVQLAGVHPPVFATLQLLTSWFLAWLVVPLSIVFMWIRYLVVHDWIVTSWHIAVLSVCLFFAVRNYMNTRRTLRGKIVEPFKLMRDVFTFRTVRRLVLWIGFMGVLCFVSQGAINGRPTSTWSNVNGLHTVVPFILQMRPLAQEPFANLHERDISSKPADWNDSTSSLSLVRGAMLRGRDLRWANARRAFLVNADLRFADLRHSSVAFADLRGADLDSSRLDSADLQWADLRGCLNLSQNDLRNSRNYKLAWLDNAVSGGLLRFHDHNKRLDVRNLSNYTFTHDDLSGVDFSGCDLHEAELDSTILDSAIFVKANLQGVDFRGAAGLTRQQVQSARNFVFAHFDHILLDSLRLPLDHNGHLNAGVLRGYSFDSLDMTDADLSGFVFAGGVSFRKTILRSADISNVDLSDADLGGANLQAASVAGANLGGALLRNAAFDSCQLLGASLANADLQGADFRGAIELNVDSLRKARNFTLARYDDTLYQLLGLKIDHNRLLDKGDLRGYDFRDHNMWKADMAGFHLDAAKFHGCILAMAYLSNTVLRKCDFTGARLDGANLDSADAYKAVFKNAHLRNATFNSTNIQDADLRGVDAISVKAMQAARNHKLAYYDDKYFEALKLDRNHNTKLALKDLQDYSFANDNMIGAILAQFDLRRADFTGAELTGADVQLADLRGAKGLSKRAIKSLRNYKIAYFDSAYFDSAGLLPHHNDNLRKKNLSGYNFRGLDMRGADLSGFTLDSADFSKTILIDANLSDVDLTKVLGLTTNQIRNAVTDKHTIMTREMEDELRRRY